MGYNPLNPNGQALAADSQPVVLPQSQIDALTPPAAISGFATESTLSALNTKIPASPATSGKQDTGNASLSSIDGKLTDVATQTTLALIKAKTDNIPALGQALAAASVPVVLTATQLSTLTPPAAITGFATEAKQDEEIGLLTDIETNTSDTAENLGDIASTVAVLGTTTYTEGTTSGITIGAVRRDADTPLVNTTNEVAPLIVDARGFLKTEVFSGEALPVTDNSSSLSVDWNGTQPVTGSGNATGALRVELPTNGTGVIASVTQNPDIRQATASNLNAQVVGSVAHDGVDSGKPVKIGMKAIAHGSNPTAVAAADVTDWYTNRHGIPFMIGGHPNIITKNLNVTDADGAQTDTALVTVSSGSKIVVTHITVTVDAATTAANQVRIGFGTANTPAADSAGIILAHAGIPPGSGVSVGNGGGIIGVGADNEDLRLTCEDPAGGSLDIVVGYYTIES